MCNNREQKKRSFVFKRTLKCSIYAIFLIFSLSAFVYFLICNLLNFYELLFPNFFTHMGNVEYTASLIQNQIGGDVFRIETVSSYPADYRDTTNQAKNEQNENARPELVNHLDDVSQYDTIYLGFPNWWGDMPMAVYSFLEEYDFTGKEIHVFVCHGGSGASGTISTIQSLQSGASVDENPLTVYWTDVENAENLVMNWLN